MKKGALRFNRWIMLTVALLFSTAAQPHVPAINWDLYEPGVIHTSIALTDKGARVLYVVSVPQLKAGGYGDYTGFLSVAVDGIVLRSGESRCDVSGSAVWHDAARASYNFELSYDCHAEHETLYIVDNLFRGSDYLNRVSIHLDFNTLRAEINDGEREIEIPVGYLLWERGWTLPVTLPAIERPKKPIMDYFKQGFEHVVGGYDHLAFLFGVILLVVRLRDLALLVTAFTLAHSITLTLAALDVIAIPVRLAEAAIAFSIIYIGFENLLNLRHRGMRGTLQRRWVTTFLFGLIHGFGFSYQLREIGLPQESMVPALLLFNLGVEAGQLAVVVAPFLLLRWCIERLHYRMWPELVGSTAVILLGMNWFYLRVVPV